MIDREKVIEELERLSEWLFLQYQVVYDGDAQNYYDAYKTVDDALTLLKEQEPKLVRIDEDSVHCPSCGNELFTYPRQKFCDECGQELKWE